MVHQQEKTLKSEIALLRSKLGILETELLQCRNKIKKLMDEIQIEQRSHHQHHENRQQLEHRLMSEVDRLQADIDYAIHTSDNTVMTADGLKKEVMLIEMSIGEKKKQLEKLVQEMKEVNLQSLTVTTTEDIPVGEGLYRNQILIVVIFGSWIDMLLKVPPKQEDELLGHPDSWKMLLRRAKTLTAFGFEATTFNRNIAIIRNMINYYIA